jgi:hypothetical protein
MPKAKILPGTNKVKKVSKNTQPKYITFESKDTLRVDLLNLVKLNPEIDSISLKVAIDNSLKSMSETTRRNRYRECMNLLEDVKSEYRHNLRLERKREWYANNRERLCEDKRKYYANNKETILKRMRAYYYNNRETILERKKVYYKTNAEVINERRRLRTLEKLNQTNKQNVNKQVNNKKTNNKNLKNNKKNNNKKNNK